MTPKAQTQAFVRRDDSGRGTGKDATDYWFRVTVLSSAEVLDVPVAITRSCPARVDGLDRQLTEEDRIALARRRLDDRLREGFVPMKGMTLDDYDAVLCITSDVFGDIARRALREGAIHERLVVEVIKATLVASLVNIEYEFKSAEIGPSKFPTKVEGPAHWWVRGQATETNTHRTMPGFGASEDFDLTNPHAVEAEFLVAAARAYVDAINAITPFRRGQN